MIFLLALLVINYVILIVVFYDYVINIVKGFDVLLMCVFNLVYFKFFIFPIRNLQWNVKFDLKIWVEILKFD